MATLLNAVGTTLRKIRTEQGLTMREIAEHSFISIGHISEIERGMKQASFEMLELMAESLDLTTAQLVKEIYKYLEEQNA